MKLKEIEERVERLKDADRRYEGKFGFSLIRSKNLSEAVLMAMSAKTPWYTEALTEGILLSINIAELLGEDGTDKFRSLEAVEQECLNRYAEGIRLYADGEIELVDLVDLLMARVVSNQRYMELTGSLAAETRYKLADLVEKSLRIDIEFRRAELGMSE